MWLFSFICCICFTNNGILMPEVFLNIAPYLRKIILHFKSCTHTIILFLLSLSSSSSIFLGVCPDSCSLYSFLVAGSLRVWSYPTQWSCAGSPEVLEVTPFLLWQLRNRCILQRGHCWCSGKDSAYLPPSYFGFLDTKLTATLLG